MKFNISKIFFYFGLFLLLSCASNEKRPANDFDLICQIYTHVMTSSQTESRTLGEKMTLISQKVNDLVTSKSALNAFEAYNRANPQIRYNLLKKVAEHTLNSSWDCPILKELNLSQSM
jgi:hypothetical protein